MPDRAPTEPSAAARRVAAQLWQMFVALKAEGFSERQALVVLGQVLAAGQQGNRG